MLFHRCCRITSPYLWVCPSPVSIMTIELIRLTRNSSYASCIFIYCTRVPHYGHSQRSGYSLLDRDNAEDFLATFGQSEEKKQFKIFNTVSKDHIQATVAIIVLRLQLFKIQPQLISSYGYYLISLAHISQQISGRTPPIPYHLKITDIKSRSPNIYNQLSYYHLYFTIIWLSSNQGFHEGPFIDVHLPLPFQFMSNLLRLSARKALDYLGTLAVIFQRILFQITQRQQYLLHTILWGLMKRMAPLSLRESRAAFYHKESDLMDRSLAHTQAWERYIKLLDDISSRFHNFHPLLSFMHH